MKTYDFDRTIARANTNCVKYDLRKEMFSTDKVIPMWVADMDFETPDFIIDALRQRLNHPILGYSIKPNTYYDAIINWYQKLHNWSLQKDWILFSPGVVPALSLIVEVFTNPGDEIMVQSPVYFPFFSVISDNSRVLVNNPLVLKNGRYAMDMDDFIAKITDKTKMVFICNPHNPGGMVWKREELMAIAEICLKKNILILADEIHGDLVYSPHQYIPIASLNQDIANITITACAPSKTFNIAGLSTSSVIIPNKALNQKFKQKLEVSHLYIGNLFGNAALEAAYTYGADWLEQLLAYLNGNIAFAMEYFRTRLPQIIPMQPEATFLLWLNCKGLGMTDNQLADFMINKANLGLNAGNAFGEGGSGYMRMNIACPRKVLEASLNQLEAAVQNL